MPATEDTALDQKSMSLSDWSCRIPPLMLVARNPDGILWTYPLVPSAGTQELSLLSAG